ncbi:MAG: alpha/beta fold hydrolase [Candidatus Melainabacteria bacterium]|nr:alpha/beta fold hydrolase [Candidatus Melainabacteria bacterium]
MSDIASVTLPVRSGPQSYYQWAIDGLRSIVARVSKGLPAPKTITEPVKKALHKVSDLLSILENGFLLGFETDKSNRYTKQPLQLDTARNLLTRGLSANETKNSGLTQIKISPEKKSMDDVFHIFSGIRTSAYYKLDGAIKFAQAGIETVIGNYRGFGENFSERKANHQTMIEDAKSRLKASLVKSKRASVLGHSLGAAIASRALADLSDEHEIRSCNFVAVSSWNSFKAVAPLLGIKPFNSMLRSYIQHLFQDKFDTSQNLCKVIDKMVTSYQKNPPQAHEKFRLIVVHGNNDNHVSEEHARELKNTIETYVQNSVPKELQSHFLPVEYLAVPEAGHFTVKHGDGNIPWVQIIDILKGQKAESKLANPDTKPVKASQIQLKQAV